jgi:hypothetical protein
MGNYGQATVERLAFQNVSTMSSRVRKAFEVPTKPEGQMKMALVCGCGLAWCCATCSGQTDSCQEHGPALFFPPIHLRLENSIEPQKPTEESARSGIYKNTGV